MVKIGMGAYSKHSNIPYLGLCQVHCFFQRIKGRNKFLNEMEGERRRRKKK